MTAAPQPSSAPQRLGTARRRLPPLLAGVCFGLGYGVVHRLMAIEFPTLVQLGQAFEVREFPGTSLEALRLKTGAAAQSIRGDLGVLELEEQEQARPIEAPLEPAAPIQSRPAEQQPFTEPLDAEPEPEPEPVQPEVIQEELPPDLPAPPTP